MALDERTAIAITNWLMDKCPDLTCPICKSKEWSGSCIGYGPIAATPLTEGIRPATFPDKNVLALVYVICKHCAHALAFDAGLMDLDKTLPST
jgi:hypothetical protein